MRARAAAALLALVAAIPARAEPPALHYDGAVDGAVTAGAAALWIASEAAKKKLAPAECRWCAESALDARARDLLLWSNAGRAGHASDALAFGVLPAGIAAHQLLAARNAGEAKEGLVDLLIVA
ncbi:MAG TPA: PAP2 family protein, partial [Anaeromyxobacter sp.]|nr:PAP2 family protein [Anaeromyxobacter sp.]